MNIAITGGTGFLGYHLMRAFHGRDGHTVRLVDLADLAADDELPDPPPEVVRCDIRDLSGLKAAFSGCDAVVHGAGALPLFPLEEIYSTNVFGTEAVLFVARELGIRRAVHVSSTAVYGVPRKHPIEETDPLVGVGPYGTSKILAEKICEKYRRLGMCVCVIRPKTFLGTHRLGVFQLLFDWVESGKKVPCIGNGHNRYQLLEVQDLAEAIWLGLTAPEQAANDTFNVGASRFGTVRDDLGALGRAAGYERAVMGTPAMLVKPLLALFEWLGLSPLYKWVYGTANKQSYVSTAKIEQALGWKARFSNAEALVHAFEWYRANKAMIPKGSGVTHRIGWKPGILGFFKLLAPKARRIEAVPAAEAGKSASGTLNVPGTAGTS